MKKIIMLVLMVVLFGNIFTEEIIFNKGKKIILKDNNTWEIVKEEKKEGFDFRKANWGMTTEEVKNTEELELIKEDSTYIAYKGNILNTKMYVVYFFVDNFLINSKYMVSEIFSNKNDYLNKYLELKDMIDKKYGVSKDETYWKNDLYRDDYQQWGFAVGLGHLTKSCTWENDKSKLSLQLTGNNYTVNLSLFYDTKNKELLLLKDNKNAKDLENNF